MSENENPERETAQWKEEIHGDVEHVLNLRRGGELLGHVKCIEEKSKVDQTPVFYVMNLLITKKERGNAGIIIKLVKELRRLAESIGAKEIYWVATKRDMPGLSKKLTYAGIADQVNIFTYVIPIENLDEKVIFGMLKTYRQEMKDDEV